MNMKKKWKQAGVAILVTGLTITGATYVWADEENNITTTEKDSEVEVVENSTSKTLESRVTDAQQESTSNTDEVSSTVTEKESTTDPEVISIKDILEEESEEVSKDDNALKEGDKTTEEKSERTQTPKGYTAGNLAALGKAYEKVQNPTAKAAIKRNMERSVENCKNKQMKKEMQNVESSVQTSKVQAEETKNVKEKKSPQAQLNEKHREERKELKEKQKAEREALKAQKGQTEEN